MSEHIDITPEHAPLLIPAAAFATGIWLGYVWPEHIPLTAAFLAAVFVGLFLLRRRVWALACLMGAVGAVSLGVHWPVQKIVAPVAEERFVGKVTEVRRGLVSSRMIAECREEGKDTPLRLLLNLDDALPVVEEGDSVAFRGELVPIEPPLVDGELTAWGFAWQRGVRQMAELKEGDIEVTARCDGFGASLAEQRREFVAAVMSCGVDLPAARFLSAILAGDAGAMDDDTRQTFARAGVAHMLAMSGTHVGIIVVLAWLLFFHLSLGGHRRLASAGCMVLLWVYILLTGAAPPAVRAALMASAVAIGQMTGLNRNGLNSLCAAALLILVFEPLTLMDAGFQLSVAAVASILLFMPVVRSAADATEAGRRLMRRRLVRGAVLSVGTCLAAVAGTAPLSAYWFHMFPLLFLLADMMVVPLLPVMMVAGFAATVCHAAGWEVPWLCISIDWLYGVMEGTCGWLAEVPGGVVENIGFPAWLMLPCYGALWALWMGAVRRRAVFVAAACLLLLFTAVMRLTVIPARSEGRTEVFVPAERYCTAVVAREGRRCYLLTDAGTKGGQRLKERLEWRYSRYLLENGIDSIDMADAVSGSRRVYADRKCWAFDGFVIALLGEEGVTRLPVKPDILLVTRGFDGDLTEAFRRSGAKMAVFSPAVYGYRRRRFEAAVKEAGIPFADRLPSRLIPR